MYVVQVKTRVCDCPPARIEHGESRSMSAAIERADAVWSLLVVFWGDYPLGVQVAVIDSRDGTTVWRNGRHTRRGE